MHPSMDILIYFSMLLVNCPKEVMSILRFQIGNLYGGFRQSSEHMLKTPILKLRVREPPGSLLITFKESAPWLI